MPEKVLIRLNGTFTMVWVCWVISTQTTVTYSINGKLLTIDKAQIVRVNWMHYGNITYIKGSHNVD